MISWARELSLCSQWLEIIAAELPLRGHDLDSEEALRLSTYASGIQVQARRIFDSLEEIARNKEGAS
jgi:hypothetical protein